MIPLGRWRSCDENIFTELSTGHVSCFHLEPRLADISAMAMSPSTEMDQREQEDAGASSTFSCYEHCSPSPYVAPLELRSPASVPQRQPPLVASLPRGTAARALRTRILEARSSSRLQSQDGNFSSGPSDCPSPSPSTLLPQATAVTNDDVSNARPSTLVRPVRTRARGRTGHRERLLETDEPAPSTREAALTGTPFKDFPPRHTPAVVRHQVSSTMDQSQETQRYVSPVRSRDGSDPAVRDTQATADIAVGDSRLPACALQDVRESDAELHSSSCLNPQGQGSTTVDPDGRTRSKPASMKGEWPRHGSMSSVGLRQGLKERGEFYAPAEGGNIHKCKESSLKDQANPHSSGKVFSIGRKQFRSSSRNQGKSNPKEAKKAKKASAFNHEKLPHGDRTGAVLFALGRRLMTEPRKRVKNLLYASTNGIASPEHTSDPTGDPQHKLGRSSSEKSPMTSLHHSLVDIASGSRCTRRSGNIGIPTGPGLCDEWSPCSDGRRGAESFVHGSVYPEQRWRGEGILSRRCAEGDSDSDTGSDDSQFLEEDREGRCRQREHAAAQECRQRISHQHSLEQKSGRDSCGTDTDEETRRHTSWGSFRSSTLPARATGTPFPWHQPFRQQQQQQQQQQQGQQPLFAGSDGSSVGSDRTRMSASSAPSRDEVRLHREAKGPYAPTIVTARDTLLYRDAGHAQETEVSGTNAPKSGKRRCMGTEATARDPQLYQGGAKKTPGVSSATALASKFMAQWSALGLAAESKPVTGAPESIHSQSPNEFRRPGDRPDRASTEPSGAASVFLSLSAHRRERLRLLAGSSANLEQLRSQVLASAPSPAHGEHADLLQLPHKASQSQNGVAEGRFNCQPGEGLESSFAKDSTRVGLSSQRQGTLLSHVRSSWGSDQCRGLSISSFSDSVADLKPPMSPAQRTPLAPASPCLTDRAVREAPYSALLRASEGALSLQDTGEEVHGFVEPAMTPAPRDHLLYGNRKLPASEKLQQEQFQYRKRARQKYFPSAVTARDSMLYAEAEGTSLPERFSYTKQGTVSRESKSAHRVLHFCPRLMHSTGHFLVEGLEPGAWLGLSEMMARVDSGVLLGGEGKGKCKREAVHKLRRSLGKRSMDGWDGSPQKRARGGSRGIAGVQGAEGTSGHRKGASLDFRVPCTGSIPDGEEAGAADEEGAESGGRESEASGDGVAAFQDALLQAQGQGHVARLARELWSGFVVPPDACCSSGEAMRPPSGRGRSLFPLFGSARDLARVESHSVPLPSQSACWDAVAAAHLLSPLIPTAGQAPGPPVLDRLADKPQFSFFSLEDSANGEANTGKSEVHIPSRKSIDASLSSDKSKLTNRTSSPSWISASSGQQDPPCRFSTEWLSARTPPRSRQTSTSSIQSSLLGKEIPCNPRKSIVIPRPPIKPIQRPTAPGSQGSTPKRVPSQRESTSHSPQHGVPAELHTSGWAARFSPDWLSASGPRCSMGLPEEDRREEGGDQSSDEEGVRRFRRPRKSMGQRPRRYLTEWLASSAPEGAKPRDPKYTSVAREGGIYLSLKRMPTLSHRKSGAFLKPSMDARNSRTGAEVKGRRTSIDGNRGQELTPAMSAVAPTASEARTTRSRLSMDSRVYPKPSETEQHAESCVMGPAAAETAVTGHWTAGGGDAQDRQLHGHSGDSFPSKAQSARTPEHELAPPTQHQEIPASTTESDDASPHLRASQEPVSASQVLASPAQAISSPAVPAGEVEGSCKIELGEQAQAMGLEWGQEEKGVSGASTGSTSSASSLARPSKGGPPLVQQDAHMEPHMKLPEPGSLTQVQLQDNRDHFTKLTAARAAECTGLALPSASTEWGSWRAWAAVFNPSSLDKEEGVEGSAGPGSMVASAHQLALALNSIMALLVLVGSLLLAGIGGPWGGRGRGTTGGLWMEVQQGSLLSGGQSGSGVLMAVVWSALIFTTMVVLGCLWVVWQVTERLEKRKSALLQELVAARECEASLRRAKKEFLGSLSHEIRTPLNGIIGMLQFLLDEGGLGEEEQEALDTALMSCWDLVDWLSNFVYSELGLATEKQVRIGRHTGKESEGSADPAGGVLPEALGSLSRDREDGGALGFFSTIASAVVPASARDGWGVVCSFLSRVVHPVQEAVGRAPCCPSMEERVEEASSRLSMLPPQRKVSWGSKGAKGHGISKRADSGFASRDQGLPEGSSAETGQMVATRPCMPVRSKGDPNSALFPSSPTISMRMSSSVPAGCSHQASPQTLGVVDSLMVDSEERYAATSVLHVLRRRPGPDIRKAPRNREHSSPAQGKRHRIRLSPSSTQHPCLLEKKAGARAHSSPSLLRRRRNVSSTEGEEARQETSVTSVCPREKRGFAGMQSTGERDGKVDVGKRRLRMHEALHGELKARSCSPGSPVVHTSQPSILRSLNSPRRQALKVRDTPPSNPQGSTQEGSMHQGGSRPTDKPERGESMEAASVIATGAKKSPWMPGSTLMPLLRSPSHASATVSMAPRVLLQSSLSTGSLSRDSSLIGASVKFGPSALIRWLSPSHSGPGAVEAEGRFPRDQAEISAALYVAGVSVLSEKLGYCEVAASSRGRQEDPARARPRTEGRDEVCLIPRALALPKAGLRSSLEDGATALPGAGIGAETRGAADLWLPRRATADATHQGRLPSCQTSVRTGVLSDTGESRQHRRVASLEEKCYRGIMGPWVDSFSARVHPDYLGRSLGKNGPIRRSTGVSNVPSDGASFTTGLFSSPQLLLPSGPSHPKCRLSSRALTISSLEFNVRDAGQPPPFAPGADVRIRPGASRNAVRAQLDARGQGTPGYGNRLARIRSSPEQLGSPGLPEASAQGACFVEDSPEHAMPLLILPQASLSLQDLLAASSFTALDPERAPLQQAWGSSQDTSQGEGDSPAARTADGDALYLDREAEGSRGVAGGTAVAQEEGDKGLAKGPFPAAVLVPHESSPGHNPRGKMLPIPSHSSSSPAFCFERRVRKSQSQDKPTGEALRELQSKERRRVSQSWVESSGQGSNAQSLAGRQGISEQEGKREARRAGAECATPAEALRSEDTAGEQASETNRVAEGEALNGLTAGAGEELKCAPWKAMEAESKAGAELRIGLLRGRRVLVVDDNAVNRKVMVAKLKPYGVEAVQAADGKLALEQMMPFETHQFVCVFMDLQMPVMDGYEATREIRLKEAATGVSSKHRLPIFAVTADLVAGAGEKCLSVGMDGFMSKPICKEQLQDSLLTAADWIQKREARHSKAGGASVGWTPAAAGVTGGKDDDVSAASAGGQAARVREPVQRSRPSRQFPDLARKEAALSATGDDGTCSGVEGRETQSRRTVTGTGTESRDVWHKSDSSEGGTSCGALRKHRKAKGNEVLPRQGVEKRLSEGGNPGTENRKGLLGRAGGRPRLSESSKDEVGRSKEREMKPELGKGDSASPAVPAQEEWRLSLKSNEAESEAGTQQGTPCWGEMTDSCSPALASRPAPELS